MVRELTADEVKLAADMAPLFFDEGKIPGEFKPEVFTHTWKTFISMDVGKMYGLFIDGVAVGFLGMVITNDVNDGAKVAQEAFWYVHPDHRGSGIRLLVHAEKAAKELSCLRMNMVHLCNPAGEKLSRIFIRMGYRPIEQSYQKPLN